MKNNENEEKTPILSDKIVIRLLIAGLAICFIYFLPSVIHWTGNMVLEVKRLKRIVKN